MDDGAEGRHHSGSGKHTSGGRGFNMGPRFFLLAMYAMKFNLEDLEFTEASDGGGDIEINDTFKQREGIFQTFFLDAQATVAESEEQARNAGMAMLTQSCPWQDG